ncbi:hypothetical protein [Capnocytophaga canis]|uniref:hypothetical protein n=1 Tax=Capnocytophaga canis TaxID=1848903 RepID=UPI001561F1A7|nr:hypothetical protein [Capnocytophaga canis]
MGGVFALIFLAVAILFLIVGIRRLTDPEFEKKVQERKKNKQRERVLQTNKGDVGVIRQGLETIYILLNTDNPTTYISRFEFLESKDERIAEILYRTDAEAIMDAALDVYQNMYPDRNVDGVNGYIDKSVSTNDILEDTFADMIQRFLVSEQGKIDKLKTEKGKENKKLKLDEKIKEITIFLKKRGYEKEDFFEWEN